MHVPAIPITRVWSWMLFLFMLTPEKDEQTQCPKHTFGKIPTALYYTSLGWRHCHRLCQADMDRQKNSKQFQHRAFWVLFFHLQVALTLLVLLYNLGTSSALFRYAKEDSLRSWIILLFKVGTQADREVFESSKAPIRVKMLKFKLSYPAQSQHKLCECLHPPNPTHYLVSRTGHVYQTNTHQPFLKHCQ